MHLVSTHAQLPCDVGSFWVSSFSDACLGLLLVLHWNSAELREVGNSAPINPTTSLVVVSVMARTNEKVVAATITRRNDNDINQILLEFERVCN